MQQCLKKTLRADPEKFYKVEKINLFEKCLIPLILYEFDV